MSDIRIDGLGPIRYTPLARPLASESPSFRDTLAAALADVNTMQLDAGREAERLVAGEEVDLHDVMISSEEASLAFDLMMEIRNKLLEAYQEIQRMNI
jgi:flagellar hook-basal body complex protein FliE